MNLMVSVDVKHVYLKHKENNKQNKHTHPSNNKQKQQQNKDTNIIIIIIAIIIIIIIINNNNSKTTTTTGYTRNPLTLWNAFVSVQLHTPGDPQSVPLVNAMTFHN